MSDITVSLDNRARTVTAVLSISDWPAMEQAIAPHAVHPHSKQTTYFVEEHGGHTAVSLLNQERSNDRVYIALADRSPTAHMGERKLPNMPLTALAVMRPSAQGKLALELRSPLAETSIPLDALVSGLQSLSIEVQ